MKPKIIKPHAYGSISTESLPSYERPVNPLEQASPSGWKHFLRTSLALLIVAAMLIGVGVWVYRIWYGRWVALNQSAVQGLNGKSDGTSGGGASKTTEQAKKDQSKVAGGSAAAQAAGGTTSQQIYCGVKGMPEQMCKAIESVEATGIKNNIYVLADTSQVPDGTKVVVDRASWKQTSSSQATINFTASKLSLSFRATAKVQLIGGVWKVTSYKTQ